MGLLLLQRQIYNRLGSLPETSVKIGCQKNGGLLTSCSVVRWKNMKESERLAKGQNLAPTISLHPELYHC